MGTLGGESRISEMHKGGAYVLYLNLPRSLKLNVGILKACLFPAGCYAYVGSAMRGIEKRIARHRRLALQKTGKIHWHIDYLLTHPGVRLISEKSLAGRSECAVSKKIASIKGTTVPVPGFGSTDCRARCQAHLYRIHRGPNRERPHFDPDEKTTPSSQAESSRRINYGQSNRTTLP